MKYVFYLYLLYIHVPLISEINFIAQDAATKTVIASQGTSLTKQESPCCTFNIPLSLIGYETSILQDQEHPLLPYDNSPVFDESHKQAMYPSLWMQLSTVWYSKRIAEIIGKERLQQYVERFSYGNKDIQDNFTTAHLASTLKISPVEQIDFLQHMISYKLPILRNSVDETKKLLFCRKYSSLWSLYGKTGTAFDENEKKYLAWFIGWIEKEQQQILFALLINNSETMPTKETRETFISNFFLQSGIILR